MIDRSPAGCPLETRLPGTSNRIAPAEFRVGAVVEIRAGEIDEIRAGRSSRRSPHRRRNVGIAGEIAVDEARLASASWPPLRVGHIDAGNDDVAAIPGERHGNRLSDQRRAAGDDGRFCRQALACAASPFWHCRKAGRERLYVLCGWPAPT